MSLLRLPSDVTDSGFSDDVVILGLYLNSTHLFLLLPASAAFCQVGNLQLRKTTRSPETALTERRHASCLFVDRA